MFDESYLAPRSKLAQSFLEAIFHSEELIDLLRQSLAKVITAALETNTKNGLKEVLQLVQWLAAFSKKTEAAAHALFSKFYK